MDVERIKRGTYLTENYFDEQIEHICVIRASERKFYQKVIDLYATAIDYDKNSVATKRFMQQCKIKCILQFMVILQLNYCRAS